MDIGSRIKQLRKGRGITQEQLADSIGISYQAVSKWENAIALPDITLVPVLAGYFGVTTDELLGYNLMDQEKNIKELCDEAYKYRESDPGRARQILEEGLRRYPGNEVLLNSLLYVMNYNSEPDETIRIAGRLATETMDAEVKYDALRFLAYAYHAKGETDSAKAAINKIPELYFTKLSEAAFILSGEEKFDAAEKQHWISFETLLQMCAKLSECCEAEGKNVEAVVQLNHALDFIRVLKKEPKIKNFNNYAAYFEKEIKRLGN